MVASPSVFVAICTCRRLAMLQRCLGSVALGAGQLASESVGVIVVDNAPSGSARKVCEELREALPCVLHFTEEAQPGISFARNRALREALRLGADLVALVDDDDVPRPDWLRLLIERQAATKADIVFGRWEPAEQLVLARERCGVAKPPEPEGILDRYGLPQDTNNALLTRRVITIMDDAGELLSPELALTGGADNDFFIRCLRRGFRVERCPDAVVSGFWEDQRLTARGFLRRAFSGGAKQGMLEMRHLPPAELARAKRRAIRKLALVPGKVLGRALWPRAGRSALAQACQGAIALGRISSYLGLSYRYYHSSARGARDRAGCTAGGDQVARPSLGLPHR